MEDLDLRLLDFILNSEGFTARQLADKLNISEKTARERLKRVESEVSQNGGRITSKSGTGHQFQIVDADRFHAWYAERRKENPSVFSTAEGRVNYILHRLLYAEGFLNSDDLADELFVSRTTLTADMKQVKEILRRHISKKTCFAEKFPRRTKRKPLPLCAGTLRSIFRFRRIFCNGFWSGREWDRPTSEII